MSIDSIGVDFDSTFSLSEWLESDHARTTQRQLEEKITNILFSHDPSSPAFLTMATQLARIGCHPAKGLSLEHEIYALTFPNGYSIRPCGILKKIGKFGSAVGSAVGDATKAAGNFVVDHATEIAVGIAICATGAGIAVMTGYALSAVVGGVVVAGAGSIFQSEEKPNPHIPSIPLPDPKACSQAELIAIQQGTTTPLPKIELPSSPTEIFITAAGVWANGQFFSTTSIMQHSVFSSVLQASSETTPSEGSDWKTFHAYQFLQQESLGNIPHQARGESALILGNYNQAIYDLGKSLEVHPNDPLAYLQRGAAHFNLGEYDQSLADYQQFLSQKEAPHLPSFLEFYEGFTRGVPEGIYENGKGMLLFLSDFINHPIQTSKQALDSITTLVDLVNRDEWGTLTEVLTPEIYQLVTQWHTLTQDQRGELAGHAIGKLGVDILLPGGLSKVASKSLKSAEELVAVCKNFQLVQETLVLEAAAGIGNGAKIAEVIEVGQKTVYLADELGFTAKEIGQLKQAGKLEGAIADNLERIANNPALQASHELFKKAQELLKPYTKEFMSEAKCRELIHDAGIPTFSRPAGIPENFRVQISEKGAGMIYYHPTHTHTSIRVMPGKPHSPFPHQHKPYVIYIKNGKVSDKFGNMLDHSSLPQAHIPLEGFIFGE